MEAAENRVICDFIGTGRVFPPGRHIRLGQRLKSGPVEHSVTILLDQPIADLHIGDQVTVVHLSIDEVTAYDEARYQDLLASLITRAPITQAEQLLFGRPR